MIMYWFALRRTGLLWLWDCWGRISRCALWTCVSLWKELQSKPKAAALRAWASLCLRGKLQPGTPAHPPHENCLAEETALWTSHAGKTQLGCVEIIAVDAVCLQTPVASHSTGAGTGVGAGLLGAGLHLCAGLREQSCCQWPGIMRASSLWNRRLSIPHMHVAGEFHVLSKDWDKGIAEVMLWQRTLTGLRGQGWVWG